MRIAPKPPSTPPAAMGPARATDAELKTQVLQRMGQLNLNDYLLKQPPKTQGLRALVVDDRLNSGGPKQEAFVDSSKGQFYVHVTYNPSLGMPVPGYWAGPMPLKATAPKPPPAPTDAQLREQFLQRMAQVNLSDSVLSRAPNTHGMRHVVIRDRLSQGLPKDEAYLNDKGQFFVHVTYSPSQGMAVPSYWSGPINLK